MKVEKQDCSSEVESKVHSSACGGASSCHEIGWGIGDALVVPRDIVEAVARSGSIAPHGAYLPILPVEGGAKGVRVRLGLHGELILRDAQTAVGLGAETRATRLVWGSGFTVRLADALNLEMKRTSGSAMKAGAFP